MSEKQLTDTDQSGYELIAELVSLTGLPERESTQLLINIIKKAKIEPKNLNIESLRLALGEYLQDLSAASTSLDQG